MINTNGPRWTQSDMQLRKAKQYEEAQMMLGSPEYGILSLRPEDRFYRS